ncbi:hypothetical protein [Amycolatopsis tolypomycina]|uniref:Uncharacterized protein n=1 Tax=Amycolatopsis tolypomycina TaxID=208445 RepID=A0A1H4J184_9PSEU|nr:hypothetical protein [Amycolatopsis tolypomycina]SEB39845.1 hypothetical protein SAMN04489727_1382 [Amycolatopsis tolypomycina]
MTDLERKLAEALRGQAREVTPDLDAAWAEQQRRQRRPPRRRKVAVWGAPLAAVLVVLTSVLLATQLNTASPPPPPQPAKQPGQELVFAKPEISLRLSFPGEPKALIDFAGQTDAWTSYASQSLDTTGRPVFCIEALPKGATHGGTDSNFGIESPSCVPVSGYPVSAGYVGKKGGPLPAGKAVFLVARTVHTLRLYDAAGDLSQAKAVAVVDMGQVFLADVNPGSPPVRFEVS